MTLSEPPSTETAATDNELDLRRALTGLHELLVMSTLMLDRHDVDEVIEVLAHAVESVTGCQLVHDTFQRHHEWTTWPPGHPTTSSLRPGERAFIENHGDHWTCTTAVGALSGSPGQLVLRHATKPDAEQRDPRPQRVHRNTKGQIRWRSQELRHPEVVDGETAVPYAEVADVIVHPGGELRRSECR